MSGKDLHSWDMTPKEAVQLQRKLRDRVVRRDDFGELRFVAGADAAFDKGSARAYGAVVVFEYPSLKEVERRSAVARLRFPYVPGLLSFREIPVLLRAFEKLETEPDVILLDGQGIAHPRRVGLASHAGLVLGKATIGCAKSRLIGEGDEPANRVGAWEPLVDEGEVIGAALRTRANVKPLFVSIGHRISLGRAIDIVLTCCDGTRIPKPTREAHKFVEQVKAGRSASRGQRF
jgi:deoxyribonuclease V